MAQSTASMLSARPKIGLVLGGGGAKGAAHVGVLEVLEELRVPVDYIAGTSMGAVVGGLYASGMSPAEIGREMREMDWDGVFVDDPPRPDRPFRRKQDDDDYLVKKKPGFRDGKIRLPVGVIQGQKFALELSRLTAPVADIDDFDNLTIPFRAVASDISTGERVVLGKGHLARAIHASMAVPGAFSPVEIDGRLLVDGGISENIPIGVAREMGADIVIVIDLTEDLQTSEEITSVLSMLKQLSALLTAGNVQAQLATLTPRDIYIKPDLRDTSSASFDKIDVTIGYGEEAARGVRAALMKYATSPIVYEDYIAQREDRVPPVPVIGFIRFQNNSRLSDDVLSARLGLAPGSPLDIPAVERGIENIYGMDVFESVRYEIADEDGEKGLLITATEKSWGPNYLQFGMALADDLDGDNAWDVGLSFLQTNINPLGGEVRLAVQLGERPLAFGELYQPLDNNSRYFVRPRVAFFSRSIGRFDNGDQIDEFRVRRVGASLEAGRLFANDAELAIGLRRYIGEAEMRIGSPRVPDYSFNNAELFTTLTYDTLDNRNFPREGAYFRGEWRDSIEDLGGDANFTQFESSYLIAHSWGAHTLIGALEFDSTLHGTSPLQNRFVIGGFTDLSGFAQDELSGQQVAIARAFYYRQFKKIKIMPTYVGMTLEYGNVYEDFDDISFDPRDAMAAGSVFFGLETVLGPLYLAYGHAERGNDSVYFFLGRVF